MDSGLSFRRPSGRLFWGLCLAGLLLRLFFILWSGDSPLEGDAFSYVEAGHVYFDAEYEPYWPPGLPFYLAAWGEFFGFGPLAMRLSMLPWFLALCLALRPLLQRQGKWSLAFGLGFLAVYPTFVLHGVEPLSHLPAGTCLAAALLAAVRWREDRRGSWLALLGGSLVLLTLFRPSAVILVAAVPVYLWWHSRKPALALPLLVGGALIAAAVMGTSVRAKRTVFLNDANSRNLYLGNNAWTHPYKTWYFGSHWTEDPDLDPAFRAEMAALKALPLEQRGKAYVDKALEHIGKEPLQFAWRSLSRVRTFWVFDTMAGARRWHLGKRAQAGALILGDALGFVLLGLLGLMSLFLPGVDRHLYRLQTLFILCYALPYFFSFSHPTYHLALLPVLVLAAGRALESLMQTPRGAAFYKITSRTWWIVLSVLFLLLQVEWVYHMSQGL